MLILDWSSSEQAQPQSWVFGVLQVSVGAVVIPVGRRIAIFGTITVLPWIGVASVTLNEDL